MEYGEVVRLEVKSNLVLKEKERNRFLSGADAIYDFVDAVRLKPGDAKRKEKAPAERMVIPSSILRKDRSIPSDRLEAVLVMPKDVEGREAFVISPISDGEGDRK